MENTPPNDNTPQNDGKGGGDNRHFTVDELIFATNIALNNANHPEIEPTLIKRGYTTVVIDAAKLKVKNLQELDEKQKKEYSEQYNATETYNKDWAEVKVIYAEHVELGRIVFKNDFKNYMQLGLQGDRKHSFSGFMHQAKLYYNNALDSQEIMDGLNTKGITKKELEDTLALIEQVEKEKFNQKKETGEAQQATKVRDAAFDEMHEWYFDLKRVATKALLSKPALLKILGF